MSWLGVNLNESLKNIGGQITNLTREVLSDDIDDEDGNREILVPYKQFTELKNGTEMQRQEMASLQAELEETRERLRISDLGSSQNVSQLKDQVSALQKELNILREQRSMWDWEEGDDGLDQLSNNEAWEHEKQALLQQIKQLEQTVHQNKADYSNLQEENRSLQDNLQALDQEHQTHTETLLQQKNILTKTVNEQKEQLSSLEKKHEETLSQLESDHNEKLTNFNDQISEILTHKKELQQHVETLKGKIETENKEVTKIKAEKNDLKDKETNALRVKVQDLEASISSDQDEVEKLKKENTLLWTKIEDNEVKHQQTMQVNNVKLMDKTKELVEAQGKLQELEYLKVQLEERIRTLDHDSHQQVRDLLEKHAQSKELCDSLEQENKDIKEQLVAAESTVKRQTQEKEELESGIKKDKERYDKVRSDLWERERELQELREAQQRKMLENETQSTAPTSPSEVPTSSPERELQLQGIVNQLRKQLRDTTALLQASHSQQAELEREVDELREQLDVSEELYGRTPPDGGICPSSSHQPSSLSPSRSLHTIDEIEEEGLPHHSRDEIEIIGEVVNEVEVIEEVMQSNSRHLHTIIEDNSEGEVEIQDLTEGVKNMNFVEGDRDKLTYKVECLTKENSTIKALVEHLEQQLRDQQSEGSDEDCSKCGELLKIIEQKQSDANSMHVQLIYKKDQFDNLIEGVQKIGKLLGIEDSALDIEHFCNLVNVKYQQMIAAERRSSDVSEGFIEVEDLRKEKDELENRVTELLVEKEEISNKLKENATILTAMADKLNEKERSSVAMEENDTEMKSLREELEMLQRESSQVEGLIADNSRLKQIADNNSALLASKTEEMFSLIASKEEIYEKCTSLMAEKNKLLQEKDDLTKRVSGSVDSAEVLAKLQQEFSELSAAKTKLDEDNKKMNRNLSAKDEELVTLKQERNEMFEKTLELQQLMDRISSLEGERDSTQVLITQMKTQQENELKNKTELETKANDLEKELTEIKLLNENLNEEKTDLQTIKLDLENRLRNATSQQEDGAMQRNLSFTDDEKNTLLDQKTLLEKQISEANVKINQQEQIIKELEERCRISEPDNQTDTDSLRAVRETLEQQNIELENKLKTTSKELTEKKTELADLGNQLIDCQEKLSEFKQGVSVLQGEREQMVATITQKHQESVTYHAEIQRLMGVIQQMTTQHTAEQKTLKDQLEELQKSQSNNDTTASLEADCSHLREKLRTLESENSKLDSEKTRLSQERDQLMLANSQFNVQYQELTKELSSVQEQHDRSSKECARLKEHLLSVEDQHTTELMASEQNQQRLKQANAQLQEKIQAHSVLFSATSERTSSTVDQLQREVASLQLQREELSIHLQQTEGELKSSKEAASTLQLVLNDFQQSQSRNIAEGVDQERMKSKRQADENARLTAELLQLKGELAGLKQVEQHYKQLQNTLQTNEQNMRSLQLTVSRQDELLKTSKNEMTLLKRNSEERIDRPLIRNLFLGYLASTSTQQLQVLPVLATVLGFNSDERSRIGLNKDGLIGGKSWMSSIADFLAPPASNVRVTSKVDVLDQASLSQAFVRFLEEESQPKIQARLPAVKMAEETEQRAKDKGNALVNAATNPSYMAAPPLHPPLEQTTTANPQQEGDKELAADENSNAESSINSSKLLSNLLNQNNDSTNKL